MANRWKNANRKEVLNNLLKLLKEHEELRFSELKRKLGISEPTLAGYIKYYEEIKNIEHFDNPADRRQRWYRIKPKNRDKVEAQLFKYDAVKFIERISNPVHATKKNGSVTVHAFSSVPVSADRKEWEKTVQRTVNFFPLKFLPKLKKEQKMAIVITVEC